ncbi:hypothetical protein EV202_11432 [Bacteroides heparinolyticus]|uniref:Uncharacterized protein n=1 Tax=Prevotella heparinolytica TaxID=28113 RepID=A0A4R2LPB1_9BACE|nr:hypothetical protein EV202_11432 [Bacteroides heparinolyticus]
MFSILSYFKRQDGHQRVSPVSKRDKEKKVSKESKRAKHLALAFGVCLCGGPWRKPLHCPELPHGGALVHPLQRRQGRAALLAECRCRALLRTLASRPGRVPQYLLLLHELPARHLQQGGRKAPREGQGTVQGRVYGQRAHSQVKHRGGGDAQAGTLLPHHSLRGRGRA